MKGSVSSRTVANTLLEIAKNRNISITPMKLQKLVYMAHGWYLAITGKELIFDPIEAWQFGPVIRDLYSMTKHYGNQPITSEIEDLFPDIETNKIGYPKIEDPTVKKFLGKIFDAYGEFTAYQLSALTHQKGTPWYDTWNDSERADYPIIQNELIKKHFEKLAKS
ncbi:MAG: DUF4065 domain-containing protein [Candidatus Auribacterota bacterium]|jgi:uncharacterized phage-associated protein|nr:DUF4065 domain-containing protein [Candidatus Auribacterota bacterium]